MKRFFPTTLVSPRRAPVRFLAGLLSCLSCMAGLPSCVDKDGPPPDRTAMLADDQRVSTMPWNQQQGWENKSKLGALANDPRIGGGGNNSTGGGR